MLKFDATLASLVLHVNGKPVLTFHSNGRLEVGRRVRADTAAAAFLAALTKQYAALVTIVPPVPDFAEYDEFVAKELSGGGGIPNPESDYPGAPAAPSYAFPGGANVNPLPLMELRTEGTRTLGNPPAVSDESVEEQFGTQDEHFETGLNTKVPRF